VGRIAKVIFNNENFKIKKVRLTELELKTQSETYARKKIKTKIITKILKSLIR